MGNKIDLERSRQVSNKGESVSNKVSEKGGLVSNKVSKKGGLVSNNVSNKGEAVSNRCPTGVRTTNMIFNNKSNNGNGIQRACVGVQHSAQHNKGENKKKEYYKVEFF